jgi:Phage portal protein
VGRRRPSRTRTTPTFTAADVAAELVKALKLPAGATTTDLSSRAMQNGGMYPTWPGWQNGGFGGQQARPIAPGGWQDPMVPFGPMMPIPPQAIDPLDPETGRPLPRRFQYPISWNLPGNGDRFVPWNVLRQLADGIGIIRKCIEIRKSEMIQLDWDIVVATSVFEQAMLEAAVSKHSASQAKAAATGDPQAKADQVRQNSVSRHQIDSDFRFKNHGAIANLKAWWNKPDRINDWTFKDWLNAVMEDALVLDAVSLYPHKDLKGDLHSLELIDSATIKPLLDHRGATPQLPNPAFQQILHGFPRGEFTYAPGSGDEFDRDTLIYKVRNRRSIGPYGYGPTEQAIQDADLYLKRRIWMDSEYSDGVVPELLVKVDAPMTAQQLKDYETVFNDLLSGNTVERHRARFLPSGFEPVLLPAQEERYKADYDLFLIRLIGLSFDVLPTELGFPPQGGLGGKGMSEGEENATYRKAIRPTAAWLTAMINEVSFTWLDMPPGLTFQFLGLEAEDQEAAMNVMESLAARGGITINEMRDKQGLPRFDMPEADEPMIVTSRDVIPLAGAIERAVLVAAQNAGNPTGADPVTTGLAETAVQLGVKPNDSPVPQGGKPVPPASTPAGGPPGAPQEAAKKPKPAGAPASTTANATSAQKRAEAEAFKGFLRGLKGGRRAFREFEFEHHPEYIAKAANALAREGDWATAIVVLTVEVDE